MTFSELNQARIVLKMIFSNYAWFNSILIVGGSELSLVVNVNSNVKLEKYIPKQYKHAPIQMNCVQKRM
jgi:hypothetical protein